MPTETTTIPDAPPELAAAVKRWSDATYRRRHVLAQYGVESHQFAKAKHEAATILCDVASVTPDGPGPWRVPNLDGGWLVTRDELGEITIKAIKG